MRSRRRWPACWWKCWCPTGRRSSSGKPSPSSDRDRKTMHDSMGPLGAHFFRVRELVQYLKDLFAEDPVLSDVWISGEISDVTRSGAGHVYFTIRDGEARVPAVVFRLAA